MLISEWISRWEERVPLALQEEWDHCGLQCGRVDRDLSGVVLSLDLTEEAIVRAQQEQVNLIVTHHPVFFRGVHTVIDSEPLQRLALEAIEAGLAVYASHTAFDTVDGGVNHVMAELAGLSEAVPLAPRDVSDPLRAFAEGMGRMGSIQPVSLAQYASCLKGRFHAESVVYYGDPARIIRRAACLGGSGMDFVADAIRGCCDVLITADVRYHDAQDAVRRGLALIDLGHYASERPAMQRAMEWSQQIAPEVRHVVLDGGWDSLRHEA